MYQNASGTVLFYFETHEELIDFVDKIKNVDWDEYKKQQLENGVKQKIVDEKISLFKSFEIDDKDEDLQKDDCVEVNLAFDYDFDVTIDGEYSPATMWEPAEYPTLEDTMEHSDIRKIINEFAKAVGTKDFDFEEDIDLEDEEKLWEKYEEEKDYNPWEDNYDTYDDY